MTCPGAARGTSDPAPADSACDLASLQGAWEQVAFEENGVSEPPDDHGAPGALTVISGNRFVVRTIDGGVLLEGTFALDATVMPKAITWTDAMGPDEGEPLPAIYRLDGDRFVFVAADAGAPRPTVFRTVPGLTMRTFRRRVGFSPPAPRRHATVG